MNNSYFARKDVVDSPANPARPTPLSTFDYRTNSRPVTPGYTAALPGSQIPETLADPVYVPGYLATQIGKLARVEFLVGNLITECVGRIVEVGASYILMQELSGATTTMCDLFAVKFVTIVDAETVDTVTIPRIAPRV